MYAWQCVYCICICLEHRPMIQPPIDEEELLCEEHIAVDWLRLRAVVDNEGTAGEDSRIYIS